jgi:hypothetical protein
VLTTSRSIDIAFRRGYQARVDEEQQIDNHVAEMREDADELRRLHSLTSNKRVKEQLSEVIDDTDALIREAT